MPLPLLFIAIAAASAAVGVGKTVKANSDVREAKKTNEKANEIVDNAKHRLDSVRSKCKLDLKTLGETKVRILHSSINHFIRSFGKIKNVNFQNSIGLNELAKLCIDTKDFEELKELGSFATSVMGGIMSGSMSGALTAFGAYSAAGSLATASTGTAIASLSGAAATNATLAFFGGGSLAAGGLGIAGGTMVLGGLVAGPALAIMGFVMGAKASEEKEKAYTNLAKAKEFAEECGLASDMCSQISRKCTLFIDLLQNLDKSFKPCIAQLDEAIAEHGTDYRLFSQKQKQATAAAASLAKVIKTVLDTPILDKDGNITRDSDRILEQSIPEEVCQIISQSDNGVFSQYKKDQTSHKYYNHISRRELMNDILKCTHRSHISSEMSLGSAGLFGIRLAEMKSMLWDKYQIAMFSSDIGDSTTIDDLIKKIGKASGKKIV